MKKATAHESRDQANGYEVRAAAFEGHCNMKPYYEKDGIVIYHGDCREILPSIERPPVIVTDPPYGLGDKWTGGGGSGKTSWKFDPSEAKGWDGKTVDFVEQLPSLCDQLIVWGGNYYPLPPMRCWLVWDKKVPDTFTTGQAELAWTNLDRPTRVFRMAQCEQANEGPKYHPTQKPLALILWCMKWVGDGLVLDPFMGSGTTLRAAKDLGRRAIGIEIEERYCEIAVKRLAQEVLFT